MKNRIITLALFFLLMIATVHNVNAGDGAVIIPPAETFSLNIYLNELSGIHWDFCAINGTVNFLLSAPDGKVLFASNNTCNGTINFEASKVGTHVLRLSNPSEKHAVEVIYSVKSWHNIHVSLTLTIHASPTVTFNPSLIHILLTVLSIVLAVIKSLSDALKRMLDKKIVVMKELARYKSPELPIRDS